MEKKELVNSKKATQELIGNWLFWGVIFEFCCTVVLKIITENIESNLLYIIIVAILQVITIFFIWKISTAKTFKNKIISLKDIPDIMRNLTIFTIIICIVIALYLFSGVDTMIDETIESDYKIKYVERFIEQVYDEEEKKEYYERKEQAIEEIKTEIYVYITILQLALTVVYIGVLPLEKRSLENYATVV